MTAQRLVVADPAGRAPRVERGGEAALGPPDRCRARRPCAGPGARRRSAASGRPRAGGAGSARASNSGARTSGPSAASRWSKRARDAVMQLEHRAVELHDLVAVRAEHEPRAPRRAPPALRRAANTPHQPVIRRCEWIVEVALEADEQVLAVRVDRVDPRARRGARASGPGRSAGAASRSRRARGRRAPGGSGWPRGGSCRPRAWPRPAYGTAYGPIRSRAYALSVACAGPARKPSSTSSGSSAEPTTGSPSTRSSESLRPRSPVTNVGERLERRRAGAGRRARRAIASPRPPRST